MPKKDKYHNQVRTALEKDGWKITHDPYFLYVGRRRGFIDLGAEKYGGASNVMLLYHNLSRNKRKGTQRAQRFYLS